MEESEARRRALEESLGLASAAVAKGTSAVGASSRARQVAQSHSEELQAMVRQLEAQLKGPQAGAAHGAALENQRHDEVIRREEQEKLLLSQRLEALKEEQKRTLEMEERLKERLRKSQEVGDEEEEG